MRGNPLLDRSGCDPGGRTRERNGPLLVQSQLVSVSPANVVASCLRLRKHRLRRFVQAAGGLPFGSSFRGLAIAVVRRRFLDVSHRRHCRGIGCVYPSRFYREPRCRSGLGRGRLASFDDSSAALAAVAVASAAVAASSAAATAVSAASRPRRATAAERSASRHCSSEAAVVEYLSLSVMPSPHGEASG